MGATRLDDMVDAVGGVEYICVLCGSVWSSADYEWGGCARSLPGAATPRCDWSCPSCGGVVVEYARHPALAVGAEHILERTHA